MRPHIHQCFTKKCARSAGFVKGKVKKTGKYFFRGKLKIRIKKEKKDSLFLPFSSFPPRRPGFKFPPSPRWKSAKVLDSRIFSIPPSIFPRGFSRVAFVTKRLPVRFIPEQIAIAFGGRDVIDLRRQRDPTLLVADRTEGKIGQERAPGIPPPRPIATLCRI
jgi:hypothetical protein